MTNNKTIISIQSRNLRITERFLQEDQEYAVVAPYLLNTDSEIKPINFSSATDMHIQSVSMDESYQNDFDIFSLDKTSAYPASPLKSSFLENVFANLIGGLSGVNISAENIAVFGGTFGSYRTLLPLQPKKIIICPDILYRNQKAAFTSYGKTVVDVLTTEKGLINLDSLESILENYKNKCCYLYINHNLGYKFDTPYLERIAELLEKYDVFALYDADVINTIHNPSADPLLPIKIRSFFNRSLILCNMSKEFGVPGIRIGFGIGPNELIKEVRLFQRISLEILPSSSKILAQIVIQYANLDKVRTEYGLRMEALNSGLIKFGWNIIRPDIGINFFVPVPEKFKKARIVPPGTLFSYWCMKECKVIVRPGSVHGRKMDNYVRFVISVDENQIQEVFRRFFVAKIDYFMEFPNGIEEEYLKIIG